MPRSGPGRGLGPPPQIAHALRPPPARRLPLYYEGTVLFVYFLAHLGGAEYIYGHFVRAVLLEHEGAIDARAEQARAGLRATFKNNIGWCAPHAPAAYPGRRKP